MSESAAVSKIIRRSRLEADGLVVEFERSGMTRTAFCRAQGVSAHTLDYYRRMRRGQAVVAPRLVPVELVGTSERVSPPQASCGAPLRVELSNGRRIVIEEGFSATLLKSVIAALEA
jgi:transposase